MTIEFSCHDCGEVFQVAAQHAGKRTKCTKCGASLVVPSQSQEKATARLLSASAAEQRQSEADSVSDYLGIGSGKSSNHSAEEVQESTLDHRRRRSLPETVERNGNRYPTVKIYQTFLNIIALLCYVLGALLLLIGLAIPFLVPQRDGFGMSVLFFAYALATALAGMGFRLTSEMIQVFLDIELSVRQTSNHTRS